MKFREAVFTHGVATLAGVLFTDVVLEYFSENVPVLHLRREAWRESAGAGISRSTSKTRVIMTYSGRGSEGWMDDYIVAVIR